VSTLKSSAENLTLNADGSGNDIIFQSNASNVATLDQAGLLTATTFAGSGASLTALNATNLGSGTVPTARLGTGTASSSTFLRGDGAWQAAGGGKILQVIHNVDTSRTSVDTSTSSPATVATSSAITPASSSNKIAISWASSIAKAAVNDMEAYGYLYRDTTQVIRFGAYLNNNSTDYESGSASMFYVDSPGDTSAHTYYIKFARSTGSLIVNNGSDSMPFVLMEIEG